MHARWTELGLLDADAIELEWRLNPDANVGALCGPDALDGDGLTVVDVDLPDGPATLAALEREHGPLPPATVSTPSGGAHHYLRGHTASWNPGPGLEVRSVGRQCVAPPSIHPNGGRYSWNVSTPETFEHELPDWLRRPGPLQVVTASSASFGGPSLALARERFDDPVLDVAPPVYFRKLLGLTPHQGYVPCPLHEDVTPSCRVYDSAEEGWFCFGESCRRGGDVVTLAAYLGGLSIPVTGVLFLQLLDLLREELLA